MDLIIVVFLVYHFIVLFSCDIKHFCGITTVISELPVIFSYYILELLLLRFMEPVPAVWFTMPGNLYIVHIPILSPYFGADSNILGSSWSAIAVLILNRFVGKYIRSVKSITNPFLFSCKIDKKSSWKMGLGETWRRSLVPQLVHGCWHYILSEGTWTVWRD